MPYLTVPQIEAAMTALAASAPPGVVSKVAFPDATLSEGGIGPTTYSYLKIGKGGGTSRKTVLAVAGLHAREWAQPDAVISFAQKLVDCYANTKPFVIPAYTAKGGSTYGPVTIPASKVAAMVDRMDILLVPCANPDGRKFSQSKKANNRWRKTRSPRPTGGTAETVGVDPNRNFDIAWDYDIYYDPSFAISGDLMSSKFASDDTFIGKAKPVPNATHPDNEPETKNLVWLLDNNPVTWSIDLHSYSMLLMHPWGIERNGKVSTQTFRNTAFDMTRDGTAGNAYSEFFPDTQPSRLLARHTVAVESMRDAVKAATGRVYQTGGTADTIYPATGTFSDYHFSRQFTIAGSPPIHTFAAEFGTVKDNFQPHPTSRHGYPLIEREVHAVLLALLAAALPAKAAPATGGGSGSGGGGSGGGGGGGGNGDGCLLSSAALVLAAVGAVAAVAAGAGGGRHR
jgi:carboxypeptidase T